MTRSTTSPKWKSNLYKALAVLFWLGVWQLLSSLIGQEILIVSPVRAVQTLLLFLTRWSFYQAVLFSFGRILGGFALGLLLIVVNAIRKLAAKKSVRKEAA